MTDIHTDNVIHRGAPLLKMRMAIICTRGRERDVGIRVEDWRRLVRTRKALLRRYTEDSWNCVKKALLRSGRCIEERKSKKKIFFRRLFSTENKIKFATSWFFFVVIMWFSNFLHFLNDRFSFLLFLLKSSSF